MVRQGMDDAEIVRLAGRPIPTGEIDAARDGREDEFLVFDCKGGQAGFPYHEAERIGLKLVGSDWEREVQKASWWCENNPSRRPTKKGLKRFLTTWFTRASERTPRAASTQRNDDSLIERARANGGVLLFG